MKLVILNPVDLPIANFLMSYVSTVLPVGIP